MAQTVEDAKKFAAYRRMLTALCRSKIVSESSEKTDRDYF